MTKGAESLYLSSGARDDYELLQSSLFGPIFKQTASAAAQADAIAIVDYISTHLVPTLLPGLIALGKALEDDPSTDVGTPAHDDDRDLKSLSLRTYMSRFVNKPLAKGFEMLYLADPPDPVDSLSCFLFESSADEPLNPELDTQVQPLVFLAQYLMRHNPRHNPPPAVSRSLGRRTAPYDPAADFRPPPTAPSSSHPPLGAGGVPPVLRSVITADLSSEVIGVFTRDFLGVGPSGTSLTLTVVATRRLEGGVQFRAFSSDHGISVTRLLSDSTVKSVVPTSVLELGGVAAGVQHLLGKVTVVRVCRGLQLSFLDTPALSCPPPTLMTTSKRFGDELYIVDVLAEPPLSTTCEIESDNTLGKEPMLVRVRMYDPGRSRYYEVSRHALVPAETDVVGRRAVAVSLLGKVSLLELNDGEVMFRLEEAKPAQLEKDEGKEESKSAGQPLNAMQLKLQNWSSQKTVSELSNPLGSPRLSAALAAARSLDGPPKGLLSSASTSSLVCPFPLSAIGATAGRAFSKDDLERAESVWQLRRDNALVDKREELVKRAKALAIGVAREERAAAAAPPSAAPGKGNKTKVPPIAGSKPSAGVTAPPHREEEGRRVVPAARPRRSAVRRRVPSRRLPLWAPAYRHSRVFRRVPRRHAPLHRLRPDDVRGV